MASKLIVFCLHLTPLQDQWRRCMKENFPPNCATLSMIPACHILKIQFFSIFSKGRQFEAIIKLQGRVNRLIILGGSVAGEKDCCDAKYAQQPTRSWNSMISKKTCPPFQKLGKNWVKQWNSSRTKTTSHRRSENVWKNERGPLSILGNTLKIGSELSANDNPKGWKKSCQKWKNPDESVSGLEGASVLQVWKLQVWESLEAGARSTGSLINLTDWSLQPPLYISNCYSVYCQLCSCVWCMCV